MCGIAGIFHLETAKPVDPARLRAMLDPMQHRGPDGTGVWTAPGIGLGHLRLSIIDIDGSPQPMASDDGDVTLSYNGEIYNFRELRTELEERGHRFRTSGDTEVILAAWRQWGVDCLSRLNGMFAFALHDRQRGCLFLARDRLGVKPLHFARLSDGSLAFASELKGLLRHPLLRKDANLSAVEDYFALGYVPDDTCIIAGVDKLAAGHFLLLERGKGWVAPRRWWQPDFSQRIRASEGEAAEHLTHLLRQAVTDRMVADVPLGAFLSGGVDSSSVVALMAEASRKAVHTCTIGFDEASLDETAYAQAMAERFATDHRMRVVAADDFALVDRIADQFDEPFADASALPTFRVCELARENVTVALSGDGADEAFAGYRRLVFQHQEERIRSMIPEVLRRNILGPLAKAWPQMDWAPRPLRARATLSSLSKSGAEGYAEAVSVTGPDQRARLFNDAAKHALGDHVAEARYVKAMADAPACEPLDRAQYADLMIWLPGDILTKTDRMSMAVSLEAREPLLDYRLVEFAASLPASMRVKGSTGKAILKQAMEPYLPPDILYRPKMGFVTPVSKWFRGQLGEAARGLTRSSTLARSGWFDMGEVERIVAAHQSGRRDHGRLIWQFFMLEKSLAKLFGI